MASSLHLHLLQFTAVNHRPTTTKPTTHNLLTIRCGPRDNRGPLHKGRTLSIEAIQAVQTLKRSHRTNPTENDTVSRTLSRLVKSDLIAAFNELLRQDQFELALVVFSAVRSEEWYKPDLNMYAKIVTAMASRGMTEEIDRLMDDVAPADVVSAEGKGLVTVVKALLAADRAEATVKVYEMMKVGGWRCESAADEYLGKVLSRGLRRLGKKMVADEIDLEVNRVVGGVLEKMGG